MKKQILVCLLAMALVIGLFPAMPANAASGTVGSNISWSLDDDGLLTVEGTGATGDYTKENAPFARVNSAEVTQIIVKGNITSIGAYFFYGLDYAEMIIILAPVTSIGDCAFGNCMNLITTVLPAEVATVSETAFTGCDNIWQVIYLGKETGLPGISLPEDAVAEVVAVGGTDAGTTGELSWFAMDDGSTYSLYIYGDGSMGDYSEETPAPWVEYSYDVVYLYGDITSIGAYAFADVPVTYIDIPDGLTKIGAYAMNALDIDYPIDLPAGLTTIGANALPEGVPYIFTGSRAQLAATAAADNPALFGDDAHVFFRMPGDMTFDGVLDSADIVMWYEIFGDHDIGVDGEGGNEGDGGEEDEFEEIIAMLLDANADLTDSNNNCTCNGNEACTGGANCPLDCTACRDYYLDYLILIRKVAGIE